MKNITKLLAQNQVSSLYYYHIQEIKQKQDRQEKIKKDAQKRLNQNKNN